MNPVTDPSTILIADDESSIVDLFQSWLQDEYRIRTATTGSDALDQFDSEIDVVLLDRQMAELSGSEVVARIRNRADTCRVAIISAVEPDDDLVGMAFDDYLVKPVSRDELVDMVERLVRRTAYMESVQTYFRLSSRLAVLEAHLSDRELAASEEYTALRDRHETLQTQLDTITAELDERDYMAELAQLGAASD